MARVYYRQLRDVRRFRTDGSTPHINYLRILILASVDLLMTLPLGIVSVALNVKASFVEGSLSWYSGWTAVHSDWKPEGIYYTDQAASGLSYMAAGYLNYWSSPILAFVIFGLFGVTPEARATYCRIIRAIGSWDPTTSTHRPNSPLNDMQFGETPLHNSMSLCLLAHLKFS